MFARNTVKALNIPASPRPMDELTTTSDDDISPTKLAMPP
jgi:hypothetical protein